MREINFRGLRLDGKGWIYGDLVNQTTNAHSRIIDVGIKEHQCHPVEVKPSSVGQFTGLKDKNGKDIYEGDILFKKGDPTTTKEKYLNQKFVVFWELSYSAFHYKAVTPMPDNGLFVPHIGLFCEIIGNIHENQELLK